MPSSSSNEKDIEKALEYSPDAVGSVAYVKRPSRIANPGPAGLFSFAGTTFLLSLYNLHTRQIQTPNAIFGMALFAGGLVQLLAGMWEFPRGNVFGATGKPRTP
ncbi:hypothetical protein H0H92_013716 [Tricholoma furcatifolium]|nr:hypothetical protein H0H92_013716 [Tricholoma furcatifolium]